MKILNFGSLNIDFVYSLDHIVAPGETISAGSLNIYPGGKGLNQSNALAKAGADVYHAGLVGEDGGMLLDVCRENNVNISLVREAGVRTGNAIIQVDKNGQNSIVLFPGANRAIEREYVDEVLSRFDAGDMILLQNEISSLSYIIDRAYEKGMKIVLNPSPFDKNVTDCDLSRISIFIMNEVEGAQISGSEDPEKILKTMDEKYPGCEVVLTLGSAGSMYHCGEKTFFQEAYKAQVVDTTAAGDTFTGFFLAEYARGGKPECCMEMAAKASSIAITRKGAIPSIPELAEVRAK